MPRRSRASDFIPVPSDYPLDWDADGDDAHARKRVEAELRGARKAKRARPKPEPIDRFARYVEARQRMARNKETEGEA